MIQQKIGENYLATIDNLMLANKDQLAASQLVNNTSARYDKRKHYKLWQISRTTV